MASILTDSAAELAAPDTCFLVRLGDVWRLLVDAIGRRQALRAAGDSSPAETAGAATSR